MINFDVLGAAFINKNNCVLIAIKVILAFFIPRGITLSESLSI